MVRSPLLWADPPEPPVPAFGARGQVVISGESSVGVMSTRWSSGASVLDADFSPGIDWFVAPRLALGLDLDLSYDRSRGFGSDGSFVQTSDTTMRGAARVGYDLRIGGAVSWYPRVSFGFEYVRTRALLLQGSSISIATPYGEPSTSQFGPFVEGYAPLLVHVSPDFFVGFGPSLFRDFGAVTGGPIVGGQRTIIGAGFVVGGAFGGEAPAAVARPSGVASASSSPGAPPAPAPAFPELAPAPHRFGEHRELVLSNDIVVSGSRTSYAGTGSSQTTFTVAPSIDYFFVSRVAIGLGLAYSNTHDTGIDATTLAPVTYAAHTFQALLRFVFDVPVASSLSIDPRIQIAFGNASNNEVSGADSDTYTTTFSTLSLGAPLLVHLAPHAFVGFGPTLSRDLGRTANFPNGASASNASTTLGASLVVGGWIH